MLFQGRYEKMEKNLKDRMQGKEMAYEDETLADKLEKHDTLAMILAGFLVFLPVALLVLVGVSLIGYFFIVR